jgi:hypothetical protein
MALMRSSAGRLLDAGMGFVNDDEVRAGAQELIAAPI